MPDQTVCRHSLDFILNFFVAVVLIGAVMFLAATARQTSDLASAGCIFKFSDRSQLQSIPKVFS